jgi:hypothetical protein
MKGTLRSHQDISRRDAMKCGIGVASLAATGSGAAVPATLLTASVVVTADTAHAQRSAESTLLALHPRLLGQGRHPRRIMEAADHS